MDEAYDQAFEYDWTQSGERLLSDRQAQFATHRFPLSVFGDGGWALPNWVQDYEKYWLKIEEVATQAGEMAVSRSAARNASNARAFGEHLRGMTEQYQIAYIELDRDLELDKVCDIFTQINSRGVRLDVFDLVNALLKPRGLQLKHLWRDALLRLEFVDSERLNVYVLQVMSILRQAYCSPKYLYFLLPGQERKVREPDGTLRKEILVPTVQDFEKRWHGAVNALERAIELLRHPQEFGAISSGYLPYVSILPAFAAGLATVEALPAKGRLDAQRKLRYWYWASVFTNRYSGSVESTTARDYLDLKTWFDSDDAEPALIAEFKNRFRALDLRRETKRGTSVYNGIFNLLVLHQARDWIAGTVPQYGDLDDHHIVPKSKAKELQLQSPVDCILNRTPLSAETNRQIIRDRLPNEYLPELIAENGEAKVRSTLESHLISPAAFDILMRTPFVARDFEDFLGERQRTIQEAIQDLLVKERLDLSPLLRELDARIESVELGLRRHICEALQNDASRLPPHVAQKVAERMQAAVKKNPALDATLAGSLSGKLEFADLRELQDTIGAKSLSLTFQARFANKELLAKRFEQLAELRNGIRHSRAVGEIAHKEGEAAILWFEQVLA